VDQGLGSDEDVEPGQEVPGEALERRIRHFEPGEVRRIAAQLLQHGGGDRIACRRRELVDIERERRARGRGGQEVGVLRRLVEREVRGPDDDDRVGSDLGRVRGEANCLRRRLRAALNGYLEPVIGRLQKEVGDAAPLFLRQEDSLAGRPEREHAVESGRDEEVDERTERILVELAARALQRCDGCDKSSPQHSLTLSAPRRTKLRLVSALRVERDGDVLRVTLARPERRNAFDASLIAELTEAFAEVGDARAVVLAGEGPSFCAGADVEWQRSSIDLTYEENVEDAMRLYRMLEAIDSCPAPVVCLVHGYALGGGSGLVACADIAVATPDATFGFTEVRLGIIPAVISPFVLPRIGTAARRYFLTGERFGADVALRIGLVQGVAEDAVEAVEEIVEALLAGGPEAVREAKLLAREQPQGMETARVAAARRTSAEGQEGLRAFLERRQPSWKRDG